VHTTTAEVAADGTDLGSGSAFNYLVSSAQGSCSQHVK
jgi:hypothetical protein